MVAGASSSVTQLDFSSSRQPTSARRSAAIQPCAMTRCTFLSSTNSTQSRRPSRVSQSRTLLWYTCSLRSRMGKNRDSLATALFRAFSEQPRNARTVSTCSGSLAAVTSSTTCHSIVAVMS